MKISGEGDSQLAGHEAAPKTITNGIVTGGPLQNNNHSLWELALWLAIRQTAPRELSHGAKLCWDVIARWERPDKECWAGLLRMAHEVGVSESQASRYMSELFEKGYAGQVPGKKGKPIYKRLEHAGLAACAEKLYQEFQVHNESKGE
jgi:hypothetical protein